MTASRHLAAVVLAAGYSSRMGRLKPLLPVGSAAALKRVIDAFVMAGIGDVRVVTGYRAAELRTVIGGGPASEVFNAAYSQGMYSSVLAGIRSLPSDVEACFLLPADIPLVRPETIRALARTFAVRSPLLLYPVADGRRGHPPLLSRALFSDILNGNGEGGLRALLDRHQAEAVDLSVEDGGIHLDMDTPEDYQNLCRRTSSIPEVIGETESVCPSCLGRVRAQRVAEGDDVYLVKDCPQHGRFRTIIWRGQPDYRSWGAGPHSASRPTVCSTEAARGCPFDCGLCPDHRQQTCCVVMEVTGRCNLSCPVCFAGAPRRHEFDLDFATIEQQCRSLLSLGGPFNLQISGGEPTLRGDLPEIVRMARSLGFPFIQLNTNGIRLGDNPSLAGDLKRAGLGCVFLQFDGLTDDVYVRIRGRALLASKLAAIRACRDQELGVVLVPTLVPGVNTRCIGDILRFAMDQAPAVRAVHFQPVSYFGRYPHTPEDCDRITLPEVLREIERQTYGGILASQFSAPSAENAYCSFQGKFVIEQDEASGTPRIAPVANPESTGCCGSAAGLVQLNGGSKRNGAKRSRDYVARQWAFPPNPAAANPGFDTDSLDAFLARRRNTFSISGMAFQDAWNLDLGRLRDCFLHAVGRDGRLVPLCAYNLTDSSGNALYRIGGAR